MKVMNIFKIELRKKNGYKIKTSTDNVQMFRTFFITTMIDI